MKLWRTSWLIVWIVAFSPIIVHGTGTSVGSSELVDSTEQTFNQLWDEALQLASIPSKHKTLIWATQVEQRIAEPYMQHWNIPALLNLLLDDDLETIDLVSREALVQQVRVTFKRYVFEVLLEYKINEKSIDNMVLRLDETPPSIRATVKGPLGIPVALQYITTIQSGKLFIQDMEVANIRYSNWKKSFYRKYAKKGDWRGLILALTEKNDRFFARFCEGGNNQTALPVYIKTACIN